MLTLDDAKKRFEELMAHPWLFAQETGCCGFAAVLMSLLEHREFIRETHPNSIKKLFDCIHPEKGQEAVRPPLNAHSKKVEHRSASLSKPAFDSATLRNRLDKRKTGSDALKFDKKKWTLDHEMGVALMICYKESLRRTRCCLFSGCNSLWSECEKYSKLWGWEHGGKISLQSASAPAVSYRALNYKRGDLALTPEACENLLREVYKGRIKSINEIDMDGKGLSVKVEALKELVKKKRCGAILGLASLRNGEKIPAYRDYKYITHWVYVPQKQDDSHQFTIYTYGEKFNLEDFQRSHEYLAVYAIQFELK